MAIPTSRYGSGENRPLAQIAIGSSGRCVAGSAPPTNALNASSQRLLL